MKKRKSNQTTFVNDDFFVLRVPLLSTDALSGLGQTCLTASIWRDGASKEQVAVSFHKDCEEVRLRLAQVLENQTFCDALLISSPTLAANVERWRNNPLDRKGASVERSLVKYVTRASTRCTPFGQLAGVALGDIKEQVPTSLNIGPRRNHRRHVRADAGLLLEIATRIARDPTCRPKLTYITNSTVCKLGSQIRYFEAKDNPFGKDGQLVSVFASEVVLGIVEFAQSGAQWNELIQEILRLEPEVDAAEAEEFVNDLVSAQLLIPDIFPCPTGAGMLQDITERLKRQIPDHSSCNVLDELKDLSCELNSTSIGHGTAQLERALAIEATTKDQNVDSLIDSESEEDAEFSASNRFQVDMTLASENIQIQEKSLGPIHTAIDCLLRINGRSSGRALDEFIKEFGRRYEDREVPLAQVLDPDSGIRYGTAAQNQSEPSPLLQVPLNRNAGAASSGRSIQDMAAAWKYELLISAVREENWAIELFADDVFSEFRPSSETQMPSTYALVSACQCVDNTRDTEIHWHLINAGGTHCIAHMGRFAHVLGSSLTNRLKRCADLEQAAEESILAEISYLPPDRLGNVCQQPSFRAHSIIYKSPPIPDRVDPILVSDLLISIKAGRIFLRSKRLNRQIVPRVDHMLNVAHPTSPAIFNFLGMLQLEGTHRGLSWSWGSLSRIKDLPRVTIEGVIVSPRTWRLSKEDIKQLKSDRTKDSFQTIGLSLFLAVQKWRQERSVPRWVQVGSVTNYMVFDLENPLSVDLFLREIKHAPVVYETFIHERSCGVTGTDNEGYVNEIVIPMWNRNVLDRAKEAGFIKEDYQPGQPPVIPSSVSTSINRTEFIVRSVKDGVLFAKIYAGSSVLDKLLRYELRQLIEELKNSGLIDNWFFIRYADPDTHLRVRFFGSADNLGTRVLTSLEKLCCCSQNPGITRFQIEAYAPEYDRYGGPRGIQIAESLFGIDSCTLVPLICALDTGSEDSENEKNIGVEARWLLAAVSVDSMLSDFGMSVEERLNFTEEYGNRLAQEYAYGKSQRHAVGKIHREHRKLFFEALSSDSHPLLPWLLPVRDILRERSQQIVRLCNNLDVEIANGLVTEKKEHLIRSYIHMHTNRIFITQMRRQETVLLQLLQRHYRSEISRSKTRSENGEKGKLHE